MRLHGFSLLELIIDIAILGILLVILFMLVDPLSQLEKAKDITRKHDLKELQSALDTYYNDYGCYPTSLPFGSQWREGSTVYMREVPQDGACNSNPSMCYMYQVDMSDSCPQWNILFAKQKKSADNASCTLQNVSSSCIPPNYDPSWACTISGMVDCAVVSANPVLPSVHYSSDESGTDSDQSPSEESCLPSERRYACTGGPTTRCNVVPQGSGVYCSSDCGGVC